MYHVYILFSESLKRYYTGQTRNIEDRLNRHNSGKVISTKHGIPWTIKWEKSVSSREEAVVLERKIKKRGAKRFLEDINIL